MNRWLSALLLLSPLALCAAGTSTPQTTEESPSEQLYLSVNISGGKELLLSDNSLYEVAPADVRIASTWLTPFPITIEPSGDPAYPCKLINQASGASIKARSIPPAS